MNNRKIIYFMIIITLFLVCFISIYLYKKEFNKNNLSDNNSTNQINLDSNKNNKIMLADILKEPNEIIVTEDNIDNSDKIIERANLKKGIFITNSSREKFLQIINSVTKANYTIDDNGYLQKSSSTENNFDIIKKFNDLIDSNNILILNISNTYKGILNDNMILDFMMERTAYTQTFDYNDNIKIVLINPDRINEEQSEDLTQKEIYVEVLLEI